MKEVMQLIRGMSIGQLLRTEAGTANLARKVTFCFQMGTESAKTQVSSNNTRRRETMVLLSLPGCLGWLTCPALPLVFSQAVASRI